MDKRTEERLLPLRPRRGACWLLWLIRAVLRALSASYHPRLPPSHGGESCHGGQHICQMKGLPACPHSAKSRAGPWGQSSVLTGGDAAHQETASSVWRHLWLSHLGEGLTSAACPPRPPPLESGLHVGRPGPLPSHHPAQLPVAQSRSVTS